MILDIADDVLQAVEERAQREKKTIGEVFSEIGRAALTRPPNSVVVTAWRAPLRSATVCSTRRHKHEARESLK
jgi:hypothetical protein